MNKVLRLTGLLLLALFFGREIAYAQYPAALNEVPFKEKKRGLNYTYATARISTRGTIAGAGLPYTFNVSTIPAGAVVEKAIMWWTASSNTKDSAFTITHGSTTYAKNAHLLGAGPDKCWGYTYTTNFRGEVSDVFTENGSYTIDIALGSGPVDGFGLIILYSDSTADYVGSMTINDGIVVVAGSAPINHNMSVEVPCVNTTRSEQIFLIGDLQNTGTSISNGTRSRAVTWNWFNFDTLQTSLTAGTNTKTFTVSSTGDCYSVVGTAIYYQYPVDTSYKATITKTRQASCSGGTNGKVKLMIASSSPYTIDWFTSPPQTGDSAVNLAQGIYTFRLTDTCGNRYYDTVLIPKYRPVITKSKPSVYLCTPDTNILTASTGTSYQWLKDNIIIPSASANTYAVTGTGSYSVIVNSGFCTDTSEATVFSIGPAIVYVDSSVAVSGTGFSWASPFKTVREALNFANYNSSVCALQIWVKKGTYYPTADGSRDSSFRIIRNNIKLYGGFAGGETLLSARSVTTNLTILSGDIGIANDSTDNSYHVMTIQGAPSSQIDTNTVVDGFTITKGNAQTLGSFVFNGATYNRSNGGGMNLWGAGSGNRCTPLVANCTFTRNISNFGGGCYNAGYSGGNCSPVLRNNTFSFNKANTLGGGLVNNGQSSGQSSPLIDNCTFSYNSALNGGGMASQANTSGTSASTISNSTFNNNTAINDGGGLYNSFGRPVITNCGFSQNDAAYSGGAYFQQGGKGTLNNNIFDRNTAQIAGGIRIYTSDPSIMINRNVFYRNTSSINDAGAVSLVCANGNDTVVNNLFVQNKAFGSGPNGGGGMVQEGGTSSYIINNTFYADSSAGSGGAIHFKDGGTNRFLYNNIFYKSYNGSSAVDYNTASGATLTASNNLFSSINPRFVKESNPIGTDGIWLTNDDGLDLLPCSPAVNTGRTAPPADIRNRTRIGVPDIGAYEEQGRVLPSAPATTATFSYCQNATAAVLTATPRSASDTLKWYNSVPALLPGAPTPSTSVTGTFTWYVSQTDSMGCESAKATISVTVKPTPAAPVATSPVVYCKGVTPVALTATLAAGSDTLKWYDSSMVALPGAPTPSTDTVGTHTWYVSQKTSLNCEGPLKTIIVKVNPTPALPTTKTPITYCQNETAVALTATKASASDTLKWYNSVPTLLSGAPTPSTATAGTFTFYVSQKNNFSCEGAKKTIKVQVNPTPVAPPSTSPVIYCQADVPVALTATKASSSDTLMWYDASYTLLGGAPVPSTVSADTAIYYVSAKTSLNCEGPKTRIKVVVNPRPLPPVVVTPIDICIGVPPAVLNATGTNLKWYTVASGGTGSATLKPAVSTVGTYTYYVTQTNTFSCESLRESLKVNVRPSPKVTVAPIGMPAFVFCVGDSIAIKATSATAISYQWQINTTPIPGSVTDTLHIDSTSNYSIIVKDFYGCADTESVFVMKNPLPKPKLSPVDVTICKGVSIILYASPATFGYKYEWFKDGLPMSVDTASDRITVDTTGYFMVRMKDIYNCTVNTNGSSISQYPEMVKPVIVMSGSVLKVATNYASYQWYRNGNLIAGATAKTYTMSFDGDYYVVVYDVNGCQATSAVVTSKVLGINQAQAQGAIRVYPNPTQGKVIIDARAKVNVIVTDITGRELLRKQQTTEVDLEQFADGIYMLRIFDKDGLLLQNERINKQTK